MRPSIRQLEYAVAVSEALSFRRAAEACHVSQPALSAQIRELESTLGVRLFERDRRRVLVTEAGQEVLRRARAVILAMDELVGTADRGGDPLTRTLRMGVIPTVAPYFLPRVLPRVRKRYPRLRLLLIEDRTPNLVRRLAEGELDLLLLALEADLGESETLPLFRDRFLLATPPGHSLAGRRSIREADLAGEEVLLLEDGHCLRDQALRVCKAGGAAEREDFRASSLGTLIQMVAHGIGVTLVPAMAGEGPSPPKSQLRLVPFARPRPYRTIGLAWRKTSPRKEEFRLLARVLTGD
jgi:LysR family hydrogen peroxide-inducible transcriptional activator